MRVYALDRAVAIIGAVRDAVGPGVDVMVEAHGRFTPSTAVAIARELAPFGIFWLEEPCPPEDLDALVEVRARAGVPIAAGERVFDQRGFSELLRIPHRPGARSAAAPRGVRGPPRTPGRATLPPPSGRSTPPLCTSNSRDVAPGASSEPGSRASFLRKWHSQFGLPWPVVVELVESATGDTAVDVQRIVRGDENEVYRVELAGGLVVYPRVRRPGLRGVEDEMWAMDQARAAGVPVPEVLAAEVVATDQGKRPAMVMAAAPGRQLAGLLPSLSPERRRVAMMDVGRVLARLHEVRMPGVLAAR